MNKKSLQKRDSYYYKIRIFHRKKKNKKLPRYLLKCGCCDQKIEIYYNEDELEINGVLGSIENWKEILLPLLNKEIK